MMFFAIFLSLAHVFLEIEYDESLQQYLTSSKSKTHGKNFWSLNLCQMG